MDRREYCRQLTQELRHLTAKEVAAVRQEFMDHMEDHAEMLRESGYDEAEADARAVEAMGDPVETGREIDKQYPAIWLWLSRIAVAVIVIVCISGIINLFGVYTAFESLAVRINPYHNVDIAQEDRIDYKMEVGNDTLHFVGLEGYVPGEDCKVTLYYNIYDKKLFRPIDSNLGYRLSFLTNSGEKTALGGGSYSNWRICQGTRDMEISAGDTYLIAVYQRFGNRVECRIDLTEVGK